MAKIKINSGKTTKITRSTMRSTIIKSLGYKSVNKRSIEAYNKYYDIQRNKLRLYEKITGTKKQSVQQYLYATAKAKLRYGKEYTPSIKQKYIQSLTSVSSGKASVKYRQSSKEKINKKLLNKLVDKQFKGIIEKTPLGQQIYERFKNEPVKLNNVLTDYANKLKAKTSENGEVRNEGAIPFGESTGSTDVELDFDFEEYEDEDEDEE